MTKIINSRLLARYKALDHGFGTRLLADCRKDDHQDLVLAEQIHQDKVAWVGKNDLGKIIKRVDGLLTKEKGIKIGARTADCLPILLFEKKKKIIGVLHAGWKGTLLGIIAKAVKEVVNKEGGQIKDLIVNFGPSIGMCCYDIDKKRAQKFIKKFGQNHLMINKSKGKYFLSLAHTNFNQLINLGVKKENIDLLPFCTSCQNDIFFSYRKEHGQSGYGEMLSYIMMKR